jgi:hypothetical protein
MVDDEGRKRVYIGKLNNDFGIWISKRGYDVTQITQSRYFSFTASALTPRIKYSGIVSPSYVGIADIYKKRFTQTLNFVKHYPDEKLLLFGYFEEYRNLPGPTQKVIHDLFNPLRSFDGQGPPAYGGYPTFTLAITEMTVNETANMLSVTLDFFVGRGVEYIILYFYVLTNK